MDHEDADVIVNSTDKKLNMNGKTVLSYIAVQSAKVSMGSKVKNP